MNDPIVDEVRKAREEYAAKFNFDLDAICKDIQKKQSKRRKKPVSFKPKKVNLSTTFTHQ
jgi:hypothetical protein